MSDGEELPGVWDWQYEHGNFEVNFCEKNEFVCDTYPAHAHWFMIGPGKVHVDWGRYGTYNMTISADGKSMEGCYVGYPDDWRKARFVRKHTEEEKKKHADMAAHAHDHTHEHSHDHDGDCGHEH